MSIGLPTAFQLGENLKVLLLAVTEGEDKPVKYPVVFAIADVIVISKVDLAAAAEWDRDLCRENIRRIAPQTPVFELSAKTGQGMAEWLAYLRQLSA